MKKVLIFMFILLLVACQPNNSENLKIYTGNPLKIGVIGELDFNINIDNISLHSIDLELIKTEKTYDAIFITKEYFQEASKAEYAEVYNESSIPFFFIESTKSHMPFTIPELTYEQVIDTEDLTYVTGFLPTQEGFKSWGFELENGEKTQKNILNVYSQILKLVEEIKYNN